MNQPIRVLQWGLGAMGSGMARLMLEKSGLQIVAAVDARPDYVGRDLGEVLGVGKKLGVTVTDHPETVLDSNKVDLTVIATTSWTVGPPQLMRYNGSPALELLAETAPGASSGDAMQAIEDIMKELPVGIGMEWTGASLQERRSGSQAPLLYAVSILFVFLCLAALYESWSVPFSVMLAVPLGVIGALLATYTRGMTNDVYFQVGLLTTVGLASKNAILIVEFAVQLQERGKNLYDATVEAVRMRLRPILMTSLAFGFGVLPLAIGTGAGAGGRQAIGTGVLGGMVASTVLGLFFVPVFFLLVRSWFTQRKSDDPGPAGAPATGTPVDAKEVQA